MLKVGHKVLVKEWDHTIEEYSLKSKGVIRVLYSFTWEMKCFCGHFVTIESILPEGSIKIFEDGKKFWCSPEMFVKKDTIAYY